MLKYFRAITQTLNILMVVTVHTLLTLPLCWLMATQSLDGNNTTSGPCSSTPPSPSPLLPLLTFPVVWLYYRLRVYPLCKCQEALQHAAYSCCIWSQRETGHAECKRKCILLTKNNTWWGDRLLWTTQFYLLKTHNELQLKSVTFYIL